MKTCTKCLMEKGLNEFHKDNSKDDGCYYICKNCREEYCKNYYIEKQENIKNYYIDNKISIIEKKKIYNQTEKGKESSRLRNSKRRALKISTSDGTINLKATEILLDNQGGVCNDCGIDITERTSRHLDHIHPLSKGGVHSINNVQRLCSPCNLQKGAKII